MANEATRKTFFFKNSFIYLPIICVLLKSTKVSIPSLYRTLNQNPKGQHSNYGGRGAQFLYYFIIFSEHTLTNYVFYSSRYTIVTYFICKLIYR